MEKIVESSVANHQVCQLVDEWESLADELNCQLAFIPAPDDELGTLSQEYAGICFDGPARLVEQIQALDEKVVDWQQRFAEAVKQSIGDFENQRKAEYIVEWFRGCHYKLDETVKEFLSGLSGGQSGKLAICPLPAVRADVWIPSYSEGAGSSWLRALKRSFLRSISDESQASDVRNFAEQHFQCWVSNADRNEVFETAIQKIRSDKFSEELASFAEDQSPVNRIISHLGVPHTDPDTGSPSLEFDALCKELADFEDSEQVLVRLAKLYRDELIPWKELGLAVSLATKAVNQVNRYKFGNLDPELDFMPSRLKGIWSGKVRDRSIVELSRRDPQADEMVRALDSLVGRIKDWQQWQYRNLILTLGALALTLSCAYLGFQIGQLSGALIGSMTSVGTCIWALVRHRADIYRQFYIHLGEQEAELTVARGKCEAKVSNVREEVASRCRDMKAFLQAAFESRLVASQRVWATQSWEQAVAIASLCHSIEEERTQAIASFNSEQDRFLSLAEDAVLAIREAVVRIKSADPARLEPLRQHRLSLGTFYLSNQVATVDLVGSRPLCFSLRHDSASGHNALIEYISSSLVLWLQGAQMDHCRLHICDPIGLGRQFDLIVPLIKTLSEVYSDVVVYQGQKISELIEACDEEIFRRTLDCLSGHYSSLNDYNEQCKAENRPQVPQTIMVINDFDQVLSQFDLPLRRILEVGPRCGVFVILATRNLPFVSKHKQLSELLEHVSILQFDQSDLTLGIVRPTQMHDSAVSAFNSLPTASLDQVRNLTETLSLEFTNKKVDLRDLWSAWRKDATATDCGLSVPFGFSGGKVLELDLGKHRTESVHTFVVGSTGSGKSVLLHALVLSSLELYSPEQLELYIFDFKPNGTEFSKYAEKKPPHIKMIVLGCEPPIAVEVLHSLKNELERRADLFRGKSVKSLDEYNRIVPKDCQLSRIIIMMDEFQSLMEHPGANELLSEFARKARAYGMHLVLATQTLQGTNLSLDIQQQFLTRIILKTTPETAAKLVNGRLWFLSELQGGKGSVAVTYDFGEAKEMDIGRVAFADPNQFNWSSFEERYPSRSSKVLDEALLVREIPVNPGQGGVIPWGTSILSPSTGIMVGVRKSQRHASFCSTLRTQQNEFLRSILKFRKLGGFDDDVIIYLPDSYSGNRGLDTEIGPREENPWLIPKLADKETWEDQLEEDLLVSTKPELCIILDAERGIFGEFLGRGYEKEKRDSFSSVAKSGKTLLAIFSDPAIHELFQVYCAASGFGIGGFAADFSSRRQSFFSIKNPMMFQLLDIRQNSFSLIQITDWRRSLHE